MCGYICFVNENNLANKYLNYTYKNEGKILSKQSNIRKYNDNVIWPNKVRINLKYVKNQSFWGDILYIWQTIF